MVVVVLVLLWDGCCCAGFIMGWLLLYWYYFVYYYNISTRCLLPFDITKVTGVRFRKILRLFPMLSKQ